MTPQQAAELRCLIIRYGSELIINPSLDNGGEPTAAELAGGRVNAMISQLTDIGDVRCVVTRDISAVCRSSDQSVKITFASCRAASQFIQELTILPCTPPTYQD